MKISTKERFDRHVEPEPMSGCWLWTGCQCGNQSYGMFYFRGGMKPAHRVAYELAGNPEPVGLDVRHTCDNPPCVNPDHLRAGTTQDNIDDCYRKGRGFSQKMKACRRGHPFDAANTRTAYHKDGSFKQRVCRACARAYDNNLVSIRSAVAS